jgi:hypothetical protein
MEPVCSCPVCGNTRITSVARQTMVEGSEPLDHATVIGYRCENGHLCMARHDTALRPDGQPGGNATFSRPYLAADCDAWVTEQAKRLMKKTEEAVRRSIALVRQSVALVRSSSRNPIFRPNRPGTR